MAGFFGRFGMPQRPQGPQFSSGGRAPMPGMMQPAPAKPMAPRPAMSPKPTGLAGVAGMVGGAGRSPMGGGMGGAMGGAAPRPAPGFAQRMISPMQGGGAGGAGMGARPMQPQPQGGMSAARGMMGGLLSDERSKEKIRELEGIRQRYEALLDSPTDAVSESFKSAGSNSFEYKPEFQAQGAPSGEREGPMAHELRPLGVTERGPDGMERVDVPHLAMKTASATGELSREKADRAELEELRARLEALSDANPNAARAGAEAGRFIGR